MDYRVEAIIKTLLYSDIFEYPLTKEEIRKYLISSTKIDKKSFAEVLSFRELGIYAGHAENYYFLKSRDKLIEKRKRREKISIRKIEKAGKIMKSVYFIPSIKFVGISGALAMKNSGEDDDIDIFIIAERGTGWITRFFLVVILVLKGVYRTRGSRNNSDKICLNMILDENYLDFNGKGRKNLYTAHEIAQVIPLFERNNTYNKFMQKNFWIKDFMPNFSISKISFEKKTGNLFERAMLIFLKIIMLEKVLRFLQLKYMGKHITRETLDEGFLAFHPLDYNSRTLNSYKKNLKKMHIKDTV